VKVSVVDGNIRTASLLLVTTFVELRVVAGRSRTRAGRPRVISGRPTLIHPCRRGLEKSLSERHGSGMAWEPHRRGMECVNKHRSRCVNQMGKTQSKPLAERHGMCELALKGPGTPLCCICSFLSHGTKPDYRYVWTVQSNPF
jgi:hypothetical protein